MTRFENSRPQLTLVLWTLFIVILYTVLGDGEPILKPGLAICDPCGPKGQTPRETSGGKKKPSAAVTLSPPWVSLASHDTPLIC